MKREKLIGQVKEAYAQLASDQSQQHFHLTSGNITPEAYYENILGMVLDEIGDGTFDGFHSGQEIVEAVANDKSWLKDWEDYRLE